MGNDIAEFGDGANDDVGTEAEFAFDGRFEEFRDLSEVLAAGAKQNNAALQLSLRILEFQRAAKITENIHFDFIVATDVDAAKHGDEDGHGWEYNVGGDQNGLRPRSVEILRAKSEFRMTNSEPGIYFLTVRSLRRFLSSDMNSWTSLKSM